MWLYSSNKASPFFGILFIFHLFLTSNIRSLSKDTVIAIQENAATSNVTKQSQLTFMTFLRWNSPCVMSKSLGVLVQLFSIHTLKIRLEMPIAYLFNSHFKRKSESYHGNHRVLSEPTKLRSPSSWQFFSWFFWGRGVSVFCRDFLHFPL